MSTACTASTSTALLGTVAVGRMLKQSDDTIRRHIEAGKIPATRTLGGKFRVPKWWAEQAARPMVIRRKR